MKNVSPSSLVCRMLSPNATSDERKVAGTGGRPPSYTMAPVNASRQMSAPLSCIAYKYLPCRIGEATYDVPLSTRQTMASVSVISPSRPGLTARMRFRGYPDEKYTIP